MAMFSQYLDNSREGLVPSGSGGPARGRSPVLGLESKLLHQTVTPIIAHSVKQSYGFWLLLMTQHDATLSQVEESRLYVVHHSPVAGDVQTPLWIRVRPKTDKIPPSDTLATFSKTNLLVSPELLSPGQKRLHLAGKGHIIAVPIPDAAESLGRVGYYCITIRLLVPEESLWGV
ncbi:unnamed protein product [Clonostachys rosea f. rosea IK726]|uniref:Uncharacterized protein n=1 Tax=Clonostachys rosea f. rosea IK726 TaxID=1349383 RepID=A0ACA9UFP6_BIOOC|nr:unnamed protein product [Clonostachys rosea f. rosea IK726]